MDNVIRNEILENLACKYAELLTEQNNNLYVILFNVKLDTFSDRIRTSTRLNKINFPIMRICDQQYFINFDTELHRDLPFLLPTYDFDFIEKFISTPWGNIYYNEDFLEKIQTENGAILEWTMQY